MLMVHDAIVTCKNGATYFSNSQNYEYHKMLSFRFTLASQSPWACELQIGIYCDGAMCSDCDVMDFDGGDISFMMGP